MILRRLLACFVLFHVIVGVTCDGGATVSQSDGDVDFEVSLGEEDTLDLDSADSSPRAVLTVVTDGYIDGVYRDNAVTEFCDAFCEQRAQSTLQAPVVLDAEHAETKNQSSSDEVSLAEFRERVLKLTDDDSNNGDEDEEAEETSAPNATKPAKTVKEQKTGESEKKIKTLRSLLTLSSEFKEEKTFNFASHDAGAAVLRKSEGVQKAGAILSDNGDKYMRQECASPWWFVVQLSEDVVVSSLTLTHLEHYAARAGVVRVFGSATAPAEITPPGPLFTPPLDSSLVDELLAYQETKSERKESEELKRVLDMPVPAQFGDWKLLGVLGERASDPERGVRRFRVNTSEHTWVRYLLVSVEAIRGDESVCTLTQLGVYGTPVLQVVHETFRQHAREHEKATDALRKAAHAEATAQVRASSAKDVVQVDCVDCLPELPDAASIKAIAESSKTDLLSNRNESEDFNVYNDSASDTEQLVDHEFNQDTDGVGALDRPVVDITDDTRDRDKTVEDEDEKSEKSEKKHIFAALTERLHRVELEQDVANAFVEALNARFVASRKATQQQLATLAKQLGVVSKRVEALWRMRLSMAFPPLTDGYSSDRDGRTFYNTDGDYGREYRRSDRDAEYHGALHGDPDGYMSDRVRREMRMLWALVLTLLVALVLTLAVMHQLHVRSRAPDIASQVDTERATEIETQTSTTSTPLSTSTEDVRILQEVEEGTLQRLSDFALLPLGEARVLALAEAPNGQKFLLFDKAPMSVMDVTVQEEKNADSTRDEAVAAKTEDAKTSQPKAKTSTADTSKTEDFPPLPKLRKLSPKLPPQPPLSPPQETKKRRQRRGGRRRHKKFHSAGPGVLQVLV
ncbi:MAG: hypothetical protein MHM6MM_001331 [Cercozoa sp. M6MM]